MTDQYQILISSTDYHILVYLVDSSETKKYSFLMHDLTWFNMS